LFVSGTVIDEDQSPAILYQQTPQSHIDEVIGICRIRFLPDHFRDNSKHSAAIQLKISGIDRVDLHAVK
jgi:hypothetical protein